MFLFGINRQRLEEAAQEMNVGLMVTDTLSEADLLVTSKAYFRRKPQKIREAEDANLPIYVLRKPTPQQVKHMLSTLNPQVPSQAHTRAPEATRQEELAQALREAEEAARLVRQNHSPVELSPQGAYIRRLQHLVAERGHVASRSTGQEPRRRVTLMPEE
jgi:mRNA degradation ribonuclease J1/J2